MSWRQWDQMFTKWIFDMNQRYLVDVWQGHSMTAAQCGEFWNSIWRVYERQQGAQPAPDDLISSLIDGFVASGPLDLSILNFVPERIRLLSEATGLVAGGIPVWAAEFPITEITPGHQIQWEIPQQLLATASRVGCSRESMDAFILRSDAWQSLSNEMQHVEGYVVDWEIWIPIVDRQSEDSGEVQFTSHTSVVAIDEHQAAMLRVHSGVGPIPEAAARQLFFRCRVPDVDSRDAYHVAREESEHVLSAFRVADPRFVYEMAHYYYWTRVQWPPEGSQEGVTYGTRPIMTDWRDSYRLRMPLSIEYVGSIRDWQNRLQGRGGKLASALHGSLRWEGLAQAQDDPVSQYFCWWSAIEALGNGSYDYKEVIPLLLVNLLPTVPPRSVPSGSQWALFYQELDRYTQLIGSLGDIRNKTLHGGSWPDSLDRTYVLRLIAEMVQTLNRRVSDVLESDRDLESFDDLRRAMNPALSVVMVRSDQ